MLQLTPRSRFSGMLFIGTLFCLMVPINQNSHVVGNDIRSSTIWTFNSSPKYRDTQKNPLLLSDSERKHEIQTGTIYKLKGRISHDEWDQITLISEFPKISEAYDPAKAIRIANLLIRLGQEKTQLMLSTYMRLSDRFEGRYDLDPHRVSLLCRILFREPNGKSEMPAIPIGNLNVAFNRIEGRGAFPLVFIHGIPFLIDPAYVSVCTHQDEVAIAGLTIHYCSNKCEFRKKEYAEHAPDVRSDLEAYIQSESFIRLFSVEQRQKRIAVYLRTQIESLESE